MKNAEHVEYLYDLMDLGEMQDALEEGMDIDETTAKQAMLEWAKELVERYSPAEPAKNIALCHKCFNKMTQPDLLDDRIEIVGCSLLTKKAWDKGMEHGWQTNCPCLPQEKT
jgi:hypothetical protein